MVKREKLVHAVKGIIREEGAKRVWGRGLSMYQKGRIFEGNWYMLEGGGVRFIQVKTTKKLYKWLWLACTKKGDKIGENWYMLELQNKRGG